MKTVLEMLVSPERLKKAELTFLTVILILLQCGRRRRFGIVVE